MQPTDIKEFFDIPSAINFEELQGWDFETMKKAAGKNVNVVTYSCPNRQRIRKETKRKVVAMNNRKISFVRLG